MFWKQKNTETVEQSVKDPICGMPIDPDHAHFTQIGGKTYYFCQPSCKAAFRNEMDKKLRGMPLHPRKKSVKDGKPCH